MLRSRNVALCIIFSFITCGIYGLYWQITLIDDVNVAANERDTTGLGVVLLSIVTCGIFGLYWMYRMGRKLGIAWQQRGRTADPNLGFLYIILAIFSMGIISYALIQSEINQLSRN